MHPTDRVRGTQPDMRRTRRILVTGAAGFVGSHLVERLSARHSTVVIALDNYSNGSPTNHIDRRNVQYRGGSTLDVERLVPERVDVVYHLGEYARVEQSVADRDAVWTYNIEGTTAILHLCRRRRAAIVYAGSSTRFVTDHGVTARTLSPYSWSKAINVEKVQECGRWFGFPFAIAYLCNVYGPREVQDGPLATAIGAFTRAYLAGEPLRVRRPGHQRRNFTYVGDAVEGLVRAGRALDGREYQFGHPRQYTLVEVARDLFRSEFTWDTNREGNRLGTRLDLRNARSIGWKPSVQLSDYVQRIRRHALERGKQS